MSLAFDDILELVEGLDARSLPLSAVEGFVRSRVDGIMTAKEIADSTGIGEEIALTALERLIGLGAVQVRKPVTPPPSSAQSPKEAAGPSKRFGKPAAPTSRIHTIPPPAGTPRRLYDPTELEEDVALDDTRKRRVLDVFYKLGAGDHYQLLEVGRDATKEEIREAYFALSKEFHPDTAFGKDLGTYKAKMEKIFTAATGAYDVLSRKLRRAEYDATLPPADPADVDWRDRRRRPGPPSAASKGPTEPSASSKDSSKDSRPAGRPPSTSRSSRPAQVAPPTPVSPAGGRPAPQAPPAVPDARAQPTRAAPLAPPSSLPAPPASPGPPARPGGVARPGSPPPPPTSSTPPTPDQVKRSQDLLRMRLAGGRGRAGTTGMDHPNPAKPAGPSVTESSEMSRAAALRGLAGTLRDVAQVTGGGQSLRRHLLAASDAERAGDLKGALNALRLANALAPDDPRVVDELARLGALRAAEEAPVFETRALSEERAGQWSSAALSWLRVVEGRPDDPVAARHCANALLEANLDLKKARDLALRAVEADPGMIASRTLLARIYAAAGMQSSARKELQAATKLDPDSEIVKNLLRELG